MMYYAKPMHRQGAFAGTVSADARCPVTEELCGSVLCLPIHPYLTETEAETVAEGLKRLWQGSSPLQGDAGSNAKIQVDKYSGKFIVRLPKSLHQRLAIEAEKEGASLNQLALYKLAL